MFRDQPIELRNTVEFNLAIPGAVVESSRLKFDAFRLHTKVCGGTALQTDCRVTEADGAVAGADERLAND